MELESKAAALSQLETRHRNHRLQHIVTIDRRIHAFIISMHRRHRLRRAFAKANASSFNCFFALNLQAGIQTLRVGRSTLLEAGDGGEHFRRPGCSVPLRRLRPLLLDSHIVSPGFRCCCPNAGSHCSYYQQHWHPNLPPSHPPPCYEWPHSLTELHSSCCNLGVRFL